MTAYAQRGVCPSGYVSDFEQFLDRYLDTHPQVEQERMRGWYIWWDRRFDPHWVDGAPRNEVPVKPYAYE